jgi:glycine/D-amino acid oxidase-like deaminating enzyme
MKKVDYIVVGLGIAGLCFTERLKQHQKTFVVINKLPNASTAVSGGIINPTVLKRFTAAWQAASFIDAAIPFYKRIETSLNEQLIVPMPIHRIFKNVEEQNNWMVASEKQGLKDFLVEEIQTNNNESITAPMGMGEVKGGFSLRPAQLLQQYANSLDKGDSLLEEHFDYDALSIFEESIQYQDIEARHIVFAEGSAGVQNPFFPKELLRPNKGEYVLFTSKELQLFSVLKGPVMIIPLGDDVYKAGATFCRADETTTTTETAKAEIVTKLKTMLQCDFEVIDQVAGIRPTVKDRRPLLGTSADSNRIHFFNGLGTRGLMMAPGLSEVLYESIENNRTLPKEIDVKRFSNA